MRHRFELDGETRELDATQADGVLTLAVDRGEPREIPYRILPDGRLTLEIDGRWIEAVTASDDAVTWVFMNGRSWSLLDADRAPPRRARCGGEDLGDVTPPMPALVVRVLVAPGDAVTKGQGLVVVSAMKMETTLVAPHDGTVSAVRSEIGDKVAPRDILVDVTPVEVLQGEEIEDA